MWAKGYGAEETKVAFARARELAASVENPTERFVIYYGQWANSFMHGEFGVALEAAETLLHETEDQASMPEAAAAHRMLGLTCIRQGDFVAARVHLEEALRVYNPHWDHNAKFHLSMEPGLNAMAYLAQASWLLGDIGRAQELIEEAIERSIETAHVPTLANNYEVRLELEVLRGRAEAALRAAETAVGLSQQQGLGHYLPLARVCLGWAHAKLGEREAGLSEMREGVAAHIERGNRAWVPFLQGLLAEIEADGQGDEEALARVEEALTLAGQTGERWTDAFLHRIRGEILLKREPSNTAPAEEAFLAAIAIAQQQKAKSFELRAAMSMARLWRDQGKRQQARELLAPIYGWFTEGFDTLDLKEAKVLLDELHA
jgi:predicted ATPase